MLRFLDPFSQKLAIVKYLGFIGAAIQTNY